ncbi:hypothetical protein GCM10011581_14130 [Saccharopolyspora subtropica]|uniref:SH3 domain-containing protein n=1 Tax=Saccharopolyspora thermophila TaxID=89367 RepID=A0A917JRK2_9PSEU|nr:SH3 domain-containing protein [Saccharopolyspora subtropica]GGI78204.1 hypothetical protein GCM10011581_14130 [Saccharopolyspora subtropica]
MIPVPRTLLLAATGVLGLIALTGVDPATTSLGGAKPCTFHVTADALNVRSGPSVAERRVGSLRYGEEVTATPNLVGGFRDLGAGRWAANEFLAPVPGSTCEP